MRRGTARLACPAFPAFSVLLAFLALLALAVPVAFTAALPSA